MQDQWKMAISAIARLSLPQREIVRKTSPKPRTRLFGATPVRFGAIPSARRLSAAMQEGAVEPATAMRCATAICEAVIDRIHGDADDAPGFMALVQRINTSVNAQIRYAADTETVGQLDHWSMPAETIERGAGDCEDFAILKMAALEEAGVPAKSMSVVVLKDTRRHLYHAVLAIRTNAGFLILDNARDDVLLDSQIPEYRPLYSVGAAGNHIYGYRQNTQTALSLGNFNEIAPGAGY
ncbi:MAG: transglutaminase-like cysteine peptidase [Pseudomonadota bacterium]